MATLHPVKAWLESRNQTTKWLAEECGVSASYLRGVLSGHIQPGRKLLVSMWEATGRTVSLEDILLYERPSKPLRLSEAVSEAYAVDAGDEGDAPSGPDL